jgi:hypothetical protein
MWDQYLNWPAFLRWSILRLHVAHKHDNHNAQANTKLNISISTWPNIIEINIRSQAQLFWSKWPRLIFLVCDLAFIISAALVVIQMLSADPDIL